MAVVKLGDLQFKQAYRSGSEDLSVSFFARALSVATSYDRAVGYFSTSIMAVSPIEYSEFFLRGGKCRILCSPDLSPADWDMLSNANNIDNALLESISNTLDDLADEPSGESTRRVFATLVKLGLVEVRLILPRGSNGIFHEKVGIFQNELGAELSFVGSVNETYNAWRQNIESFEVFSSTNAADLDRVQRHRSTFESSWNDEQPGSRTYEIPDAIKAQIVRFAADDLETAITDSQLQLQASNANHIRLRDYQREALANWEAQGYRGVISFATGAGKTITALEGLKRLTNKVNTAIVVVPTVALQQQWVKEIRNFPFPFVPAVSTLGGPDGKAGLDQLDYQVDASEDEYLILVTTVSSLGNPRFQRLASLLPKYLLIADEAHSLGATQAANYLAQLHPTHRLGLSATFERHRDPVGSQLLNDYFGEVLEPTIDIADAIAREILVPYEFDVSTVSLDHEEALEYRELTKKITKAFAYSDENDDGLNILLQKRARILKKAAGKYQVVRRILTQDYRTGDRWLVYCEDGEQLREVVEIAKSLVSEVLEFHSHMESEGNAVIERFAEMGGVLVAIRCLDEGVDVPAANRALIVASTTNPRQYVQRRGRVLRRSPGKTHAKLYDVMVVDDEGRPINKAELERGLDFARNSNSYATAVELEAVARSYYPEILENHE